MDFREIFLEMIGPNKEQSVIFKRNPNLGPDPHRDLIGIPIQEFFTNACPVLTPPLSVDIRKMSSSQRFELSWVVSSYFYDLCADRRPGCHGNDLQ